MATMICPTVQQFDDGGAEIQGGLGIRHQGLDISYEQACAWTCTKTDSQVDGWSHAEYSDRSRFDERVEDPDNKGWKETIGFDGVVRRSGYERCPPEHRSSSVSRQGESILPEADTALWSGLVGRRGAYLLLDHVERVAGRRRVVELSRRGDGVSIIRREGRRSEVCSRGAEGGVVHIQSCGTRRGGGVNTRDDLRGVGVNTRAPASPGRTSLPVSCAALNARYAGIDPQPITSFHSLGLSLTLVARQLPRQTNVDHCPPTRGVPMSKAPTEVLVGRRSPGLDGDSTDCIRAMFANASMLRDILREPGVVQVGMADLKKVGMLDPLAC
ncbi:hypothetical protein IW261DRAFT_1430359 [Armillaria novae-zelandiae]|uniref:Uncharacterized protein n=1 Tax=Armillaria novae-zelandiae TaxID=153914 RepID=A0AA39N640_9AGAR|nr:hypothetical protein IW261DRAFT_1430359 [Armillaria novae-zelandiae]